MGRTPQTRSRVLQLPQAAWADAGVYTCEAGNGVGSSVSPPGQPSHRAQGESLGEPGS